VYVPPIIFYVIAVAFALTGLFLIITAWMRRPHRPDLAERLRPFAPPSLAEEAREWLRRQ
jgi:hypothetical protein